MGDTSRNGVVRSVVAVGVCVLLLGGLFTWWDTDVLGREKFCGDAFASSEISAALPGMGRIKETRNQQEAPSEYRCEVQRTSTLLGGAQPKVQVRLAHLNASDPFQAGEWRREERMSFAKAGFAGGATSKKAWLLVPQACWDKIPPTESATPFVVAHLTDGEASSSALAQLVLRGAQRLLKDSGCSSGPVRKALSRDSLPLSTEHRRTTDPKNVCGRAGFTLPAGAMPEGRTRFGSERLTDPGNDTWSCELKLQGNRGPSLVLTASTDPDVVAATKKNPEHTYKREIAQCEGRGIYVGLYPHQRYRMTLLQHADKTDMGYYSEIVTSLAKAHAKELGLTGCRF